ncbi:response regulator transcription factor [Poseidonibacter lekithochrous]|uniref:response regulator transcription factor n=1 Tax=Poseidonibacter lekithochrous TaxID=1904463 RepID=UPI0008FCCCFC|nr:response regulator transcription factor [Poseidonibacter lekithochrous]QKJ24418.1 two-component system response regulator [Poseidonibacter lekithochrous]
MAENHENQNLSNILKKLTILYIEDEQNIRENVKKVLLLLCENVFDVESVNDAKSILENNRIDIIISDINLPGENGLDFIESIRTVDKIIPVILLSAYTDTKYLLAATKLKLIDYLTKPIDFKILNNALHKCVQDIVDSSRYIISFSKKIQYNVLYKKLYDSQSEIEITLTAKELELLDYLILHSNRIVSQDELKNNIWKDSFDATDSALKNLLNKLRKKIGKESIINISGVGYRLDI